jgi:hypothetical protein
MSETPQIVEQLEEIDALFVQPATGFRNEKERITLRGIAPATIYFSDRPQRIAGHIGNGAFVRIWGEGEDNFADDPPNAVVSFLGAISAPPADVVVTITDPQLKGDELSYAVTVLEGELPAAADGCTLFIDPFGLPLSPISIAGMRRRTRRRTRRRVILASSAP